LTSQKVTLPTNCAHWGWDDHRYFGHSVFDELTGHESMAGIAALSILGRRLSKECCEVLDDIVCTSTLADPRIWPLKMTRLVAAYGSIMPAVAAGLLVEEGARIGPWTIGASASVLAELYSQIAASELDRVNVMQVVEKYLRGRGMVSGFGTPFRSADERLKAFRERMRHKGRDQLPYWQAMEHIVDVARSLRKFEPNVSIAMAAAMLDMGMSPEEIAPLVTSLCHHMFFANAFEGAKQAPALLREIPFERISYVGHAPRTSARAANGGSILRLRGTRVG
jgi:hypothetical protein